MLADPRDIPSQDIAGHQHAPDPEHSASDVEKDEPAVRHVGRTGNYGRERPQNRHETRNDDGLAPVAEVELMGPNEVLLVEEKRILTLEKPRPRGAADRISHGI